MDFWTDEQIPDIRLVLVSSNENKNLTPIPGSANSFRTAAQPQYKCFSEVQI